MKTDAISLYAKPSTEFAAKLAATQSMLQNAAAQHPSLVQASSLGVEDVLITHLGHALGLQVPSFVLDTGVLHTETLGLLDALEAKYGQRPETFAPEQTAVVQFVQTHGNQAMYQSLELRKACCAVRKLEPLARALQGRSAWITGLRREQSDSRAQVTGVETHAGKPTKYNPLVDWTWGDVWHAVREFEVPYNPLHDAHFPSIGCAPCTRAITLGEDLRAGRWWWEQTDGGPAKECGLHVSALAA